MLLLYFLQSPEAEEHTDEADESVQAECLQAFSLPDYIMEPEIFNQLKRLHVILRQLTSFCLLSTLFRTVFLLKIAPLHFMVLEILTTFLLCGWKSFQCDREIRFLKIKKFYNALFVLPWV